MNGAFTMAQRLLQGKVYHVVLVCVDEEKSALVILMAGPILM
jgi:hypothetical protein